MKNSIRSRAKRSSELTEQDILGKSVYRTEIEDSCESSDIIAQKRQPSAYHSIQWQKANSDLFHLQELLVEAKNAETQHSSAEDQRKIRILQKRIMTSFAARALAVRAVTSTSGGKTPGLDGMILDSPKKRWEAIQQLKHWVERPQEYKATPVKRIYIPKPGTDEQRFLGIPTIMDRALQRLTVFATDPLVETVSDPSSYGFRKGRNAHDAVAKLRHLLDKNWSPEWIIDADIAKCFDRIAHQYLLQHTPVLFHTHLDQWLTAGNFDGKIFEEPEQGTLQRSGISPLLCNVALNGIEPHVKLVAEKVRTGPKSERSKVHCVRYADDFIVTAVSEQLAYTLKDHLGPFLAEKGLELSEKKTQVRRTTEGFTFLGFEFQRGQFRADTNKRNKSESRMIIRPSEKSRTRYRDMIRTATKATNRPMAALIRELNPKIRGWGNYFRISYHSTRVFYSLEYYTWKKIYKWARKKHKGRTNEWIDKAYLTSSPWRTKNWSDKTHGEPMLLYSIGTCTQLKVFHMKTDVNPYESDGRAYLEERARKTYNEKNDASLRMKVCRSQLFRCVLCNESLLTGEENLELYHIVPLKDGGTWKFENLALLHEQCHEQVTYNLVFAEKVARIRKGQMTKSMST